MLCSFLYLARARRLQFLSLSLCLAFVLSACGSKEPDQRAAFIQFLQTRIVDKPGVRVPRPSDEEKKSFGPYIADYAVITEFNDTLSNSVSKPMGDLMNKGAFRSVADVVTRRDDIQIVKGALGNLRAALDKELVRANVAHAGMKQPEDLKVVYDTAFGKTVTQPAAAFMEIFPAVDGTLDQTLQIADYLQLNRNKVQFSGGTVMTVDAATQSELNKMLEDLQSRAAALSTAQRKLQALTYGS
ncbi:DUF3053 domain-containing protein [soil metagenome]